MKIVNNIVSDSYPGSEKVFIEGKLHPIQVAMRRINLTDTVKIANGERVVSHNDPVYVYDTSGDFTNPHVVVDINKGLRRIREEWIKQRNDVEQLSDITS